MKNIVEETLLAHILDEQSFFVFPTQIACDRWADYIISLEKSPVKAVSTERFIPWDEFKSNSIKSQHQQKKAIPSVLRSIFAHRIIKQNAESVFFKKLIMPQYAQNASHFSSWLESLLAPLDLWKKTFENTGLNADEEDSDLLTLHKKYSDFLEEHNLFEPAWETPPFIDDGNHYFVFFPEILSDFTEYEKILTSSPKIITIISVPPQVEPSPEVQVFSNSRKELHNLGLFVQNLHEQKNIPYQEIAISVPEIESYGPYIERELSLLQIPCVQKNAKSLSTSGAGNLFTLISNCVSSKFSYASLSTLLTDTNIPWKDTESISQLLKFGFENNCICSFEYNGKQIDVWNESFKQNPEEERANIFYKKLKGSLEAMVNAQSFQKILESYFTFKQDFFNMENCPLESDKIISRCITELSGLIDIQNEFPDCKVPSPFSFFNEYLGTKLYLSQSQKQGVSILPYKTCCSAPFMCQILVNAGQNSLSVVYKQLPFLAENKRNLFFKGKEDPNVTEKFLALYAHNSTKEQAYFSCAVKTFTGYAQASSYLTENDRTKEEDLDFQTEDSYSKEKQYLRSLKKEDFPKRITQTEQLGFFSWHSQIPLTPSDTKKAQQMEHEQILAKRIKNNSIALTATTLKDFFYCPRSFLIKTLCNLTDDSVMPELMDHRSLGILYHSFFELYCTELKKQKLPIHTTTNGLEGAYLTIFEESFSKALIKEKHSYLESQLIQTTKTAIKRTLKDSLENFSNLFEGCLVYESEGSFMCKGLDESFHFTGRIDCILLDVQQEEYILVDFKGFSTAIPKNFYFNEEDPDELPDFQMPIYIHLLKNQKTAVPIESCCFFNVTKGTEHYVFGENLLNRIKTVSPRSRKELFTSDQFESTMKKFLECSQIFASRIKEGNLSKTEPNLEQKTCAACNYRPLCRRTFNVGRKI